MACAPSLGGLASQTQVAGLKLPFEVPDRLRGRPSPAAQPASSAHLCRPARRRPALCSWSCARVRSSWRRCARGWTRRRRSCSTRRARWRSARPSAAACRRSWRRCGARAASRCGGRAAAAGSDAAPHRLLASGLHGRWSAWMAPRRHQGCFLSRHPPHPLPAAGAGRGSAGAGLLWHLWRPPGEQGRASLRGRGKWQTVCMDAPHTGISNDGSPSGHLPPRCPAAMRCRPRPPPRCLAPPPT